MHESVGCDNCCRKQTGLKGEVCTRTWHALARGYLLGDSDSPNKVYQEGERDRIIRYREVKYLEEGLNVQRSPSVWEAHTEAASSCVATRGLSPQNWWVREVHTEAASSCVATRGIVSSESVGEGGTYRGCLELR